MGRNLGDLTIADSKTVMTLFFMASLRNRGLTYSLRKYRVHKKWFSSNYLAFAQELALRSISLLVPRGSRLTSPALGV